ncbi:chaplin [Streptomyces sp. NBC_01190]|uniref:chaplin n=1 Tax=Streptomyces sp. NBC_01190 TaxID=2903767 RepID=UPI00386B9E9C
MNQKCKGAVLALLTGGIILTAGGVAAADSDATGIAAGSPGVLSGNVIQLPIGIPTNTCGNASGLTSLLSPALGNTCANVSTRGGFAPEMRSGHREWRGYQAPRDDEMANTWGNHGGSDTGF